MWINNLNPVLMDLGPVEIRWYGIAYVLGFALSVIWLVWLSKRKQLSLKTDQIFDFATYLMLGVLIGSRIFMIFWEPQLYFYHPLELLKFWEGGMSFHGGFVGIIVAAIWYCRKHKLDFWILADAMSFPTMFALALGRIANFINGELVGKVWDGKGCVVFPQQDLLCRHPQTLYAAGYRFTISIWLYFITLKKYFKPGVIFLSFVLFEGVGRFVVDFYREDVLYFGLSLGQWFSLMMIVGAIFLLFRINFERELPPKSI